jgi:hypothetical protein
MAEKKPKSKRLMLDANAASASTDQPAFMRVCITVFR